MLNKLSKMGFFYTFPTLLRLFVNLYANATRIFFYRYAPRILTTDWCISACHSRINLTLCSLRIISEWKSLCIHSSKVTLKSRTAGKLLNFATVSFSECIVCMSSVGNTKWKCFPNWQTGVALLLRQAQIYVVLDNCDHFTAFLSSVSLPEIQIFQFHQ